MEQSEYMKNLMKRLNDVSTELNLQNEKQNNTMTTIRLDRNQLQNENYSKRQNIRYDINNNQQSNLNRLNLVSQMIDNTKTFRNSSNLKFNIIKNRKRSQNKYDKQLQINDRKYKNDLIQIRQKLNNVILDLNNKIQSNQYNNNQDHIKQDINKNKNNLLIIPKYQFNNIKSIQTLENIKKKQYNNIDKQHLNLKHSFDTFNNIHQSHSIIHSPQKQQYIHHHPNNLIKAHQTYNRPNIFINHQYPIKNPQNNPPPVIINGHIPIQNNISNIRQIRPFSQGQPVRFITPNVLQKQPSLSINKIPIIQPVKIPYLRPFDQNQSQGNINQPWFRTVQKRPLSTRRNILISNIQQQKNNNKSQIPINLENKIIQSSNLNKNASNLKKKFNPNIHFNQNNKQDQKQIEIKKSNIKEDKVLESILPTPKPYTNYSTNLENPFKKTELSLSKKSSRFRAEISNEILQSIAQQSQQNHVTKKKQLSQKSSQRLMSEVNQNIYFSKSNKFEGTNSSKLKRKGIDLSSKLRYMSQYIRRS